MEAHRAVRVKRPLTSLGSAVQEEKMKVAATYVMMAAILLGAHAVYVLGGGGHNGDGRRPDARDFRV
jgi:hypothetical protein